MFKLLKSTILTTSLMAVILLGIAACGGKAAAPAVSQAAPTQAMATPTQVAAKLAAPPTVKPTAATTPTTVVTPAAAKPIPAAVKAAAKMSLGLNQNTSLGKILTDDKEMTLYIFKNDKPDESTCYNGCAQAWPPLLVAAKDEPVTLPAGFTGKVSVIARTDNTFQVAYNDMPLYYYKGDAKAGDTTGQGIKNVWFVVSLNMGNTTQQPTPVPVPPPAPPAPPTRKYSY